MGVLYEHWDPIINECFYVGASWTNEDTRPFELHARNDDYAERISNIRSFDKEPEVRLIECSHLNDEELDELETLQISYWRDLIGDRLTNRAKGGRMGWGFAWSDKMKEEQSKRIKLAMSADEVREVVSKGLQAYYQTPEGRKQAVKHGKYLSELYGTDEARARISAKTKEQLDRYTPEDWERINAKRLSHHTAQDRSEFSKKGYQTSVARGTHIRTEEQCAVLSASIQAWRDSQTEEEKSKHSLNVWASRKANGNGIEGDKNPMRNLTEEQIVVKSDEKAKWWAAKTDEERSELRRKMSEGRKRAKAAREAAKLKEN